MEFLLLWAIIKGQLSHLHLQIAAVEQSQWTCCWLGGCAGAALPDGAHETAPTESGSDTPGTPQ